MISMIDKNGDDIFENIIQKIKNGKQLEKQDLINLTFTPIMGGKSDKVTRILNAIKKGMDSETIRDLTGLTIEEIELIKQVMN